MASAYNGSLVFWRDLTPFPEPLRVPTKTSPKVLVVGGGVSGLVTAWVLLDHGYRVTLVSKEWASYSTEQRLTSQIAGALWEFPPAVCGQHTDAISLQHSKRWCMVAYHIWDAIASLEPLARLAGVRMKGADFFFPSSIEENEAQMSKMMQIMASGVRGFRRDPGIIQERGVHEGYGAVDVYEHLAPIIDTDVCMGFLKALVTAKGAELVTRNIEGNIFDQETVLRDDFTADAIINATGLGAEELAGDETCYPIRGALLRVINNGVGFPKIDHAMNISADVDSAGEIVFLVPRNDNILFIGGIAEPHEHKLDLTLDSPTIKRMRAYCESFMPALKNARLDPEYPLAQGLRPFRQRNVRVERELRVHKSTRSGDKKGKVSRIIHNYGHGGAGWSLSFGCAGDVLALVEEALLDLPAQQMSAGAVGVNVTRPVVVKRQQTPVIGESVFPVRARL